MSDTAETTSRLRAWRQARSWTLEEVAGLAGITQGYLSKIELGDNTPSPDTKIKIARAVGATVAELFDPVDADVDA